MNTPALAVRSVSRLLPALLIVALAPSLRPADDPAPKDHAIFVGLDVSVARKGKYYPVIGAQKKALQVMVNGQATVVPLAEALDLRLDRGIKLSNRSASITHLRGTKGESRIRAQYETEAMNSAMHVQSAQEDRMDNVLGAARVSGMVLGNANGAWAEAMAQYPTLDNNISRAAKTGNEMITGKRGPEGGLNDTGFVVTFEASAPGPLDQCHVAIIADYTLPGQSGLPLSSVSLEPIGSLGPAARKITCEVRRFPPDAQLTGYRVALYSHGEEVATNLSTRRLDITRHEAVLFLTMNYLAQHQGETRPPAPILMVPRTEFIERVGSAPLDQVIYARVGKDGKIIRLSTDVAGAAQLPSDLDPAVEQIAFVPALEKGKPVEGVARLKLADLVASN